MTHEEAMERGALCQRCFLRQRCEGTPVPAEHNRNAYFAIVGEAPGKEEVEEGRPFVGASGRELTNSLHSVGVARGDVTITNAIACRPPGNDLDSLLHKCQQENKRLIAAGKEPWLTPIEACRPMMYREIEKFDKILTVGKVAMRAVTGLTNSIMDMRGAPVTGLLTPRDEWIPRETLEPTDKDEFLVASGGKWMRLLPTIHPAFVLRARRWTKVFRADLARAHRWFNGRLGWREPRIIYTPTVSQARDYLYGGAPFYVYDVETDAKESLLARLRCIGIGTPEDAVVIPYLSVDGQSRFYTEDEQGAMDDMLRGWFTDRRILKAGWNCLHGVTRVVLEDGSTETIEKIVRDRLDVKVKALDANGRIVYAKVVDYHRVRTLNQQWRVIEIEGQKRHARGLTVTPDHRIWTARGWIEAAHVVAGDTMFVDEPVLTDAQRQAILGTALGDSRVEVSNTRRDAAWDESPTGYLRGANDTEAGLVPRKTAALPFLDVSPDRHLTAYHSPTWRQIGALVPLLYDGKGKRRVKPEALDALGPVGLAWWFMDDGNLMSRASERRPDVVQLALNRYPAGDRTIVKEWFTRRYGRCWLTTRGELILSRLATEAFADEVAPHVFPEARYKLPAEWRTSPFRPVEPPRYTTPLGVRVRRAYDFTPARGNPRRNSDADTSWCLTTTTGNFFTNFGLVKNCGVYDRIVMEQQLGVTPEPIVDGIIIHRSVDSELPHNLAFVGSLLTDVNRAWKATHAATQAQTDEELHVYNAGDVVVNARIIDPLVNAVKMRGQAHIVPIDHKIQSCCAGLHRNGMYVDQETRRKLDEKYRQEAIENRHVLRQIVGDESFNPNSTLQIRHLLYDKWAMTPVRLTQLGDPSTDDDSIRKLLCLPGLDPEHQRFLRGLRGFRKAVKYRGTFLQPLRPWNEPAYEDDLSVDVTTVEGAALFDEVADAVEDALGEFSPKRVKRALKKKLGLVLADGRVHPSWNCHVPITGRLASSEPNAQNFVRALRGVFVPYPGRAFAYADEDQLELRISAAFAGAARYLEQFQDPNGDPHSATAESLYGATFKHAVGETRKKIRDFAKRFVYAVIYKASVETIWETLTAVENDKGELLFPWLTLRETGVMYDRWMKENPEFPFWWDRTMDTYRQQGYLEEPVLGRRCFFMDGEDPNQIINWRVQATGASFVSRAMVLLAEGPIPFEKYGPGTGLIQNGHDALIAEMPCEHGPYDGENPFMGYHVPYEKGMKCPVIDAAYALKEFMSGPLPGYESVVRLTAKPKVGFNGLQVA